MVASHDTVTRIYKVICRHCSDDQVRKIVNDLCKVPGDKSFRDTVERLVASERERQNGEKEAERE